MIKFGVFSLEQLAQRNRALTPFRRSERTISITLYESIVDLPNADELSARILGLFADERGAWKRTYADRFREFDHFVVSLLDRELMFRQDLRVLDVGVSDARTSCDLFGQLASRFPEMTFEALDYDPKVTIIQTDTTKVTLSSANRILEVVCPPFVFNAVQRDSVRWYPLNYLLRALAIRYLAAPMVQRYLAGELPGREVLLFAPCALSLARCDPRFRLGQHDLLNPFREPSGADVVRAMNVLNPTYFAPSDRARVVSNIHAGLREGGWLVAGSNQDAGSLVHGGVYRKRATEFEKVWQSGDGPHFAEEILSFRIDRTVNIQQSVSL